MTFNISLGFAGLKNEKGKEETDKTYALFIGETVIANEVCFVIILIFYATIIAHIDTKFRSEQLVLF